MIHRPAPPPLVNDPSRLAPSTGGPGAPGSSHPHSSGGAYPSSGAQKRRVLIVEDDEPTRRLLAITLRRTYDVTTASDGMEGLEQARIEAIRNTPSISVVVPPLTALRPDKRRLGVKVFGALVAGFMLALALAWTVDAVNPTNGSEDSDELAARAAALMKRFSRLFSRAAHT